MKEFNYNGTDSILKIPHGDKVWGVVVPCNTNAKYPIKIFDNEMRVFCRNNHLDEKLSRYSKEYGIHVFYLGTFKNVNGTLVKFFSFPIKENAKDLLNATVVMNSCTDLVGMCERYGVDVCILPQLQDKDDFIAWVNCYRDMTNLILDNKFVMVYRIPQK